MILCNQEFAIGVYCQDITDPDVMDEEFIDAWANILGARITIPLTGDLKKANRAIEVANRDRSSPSWGWQRRPHSQ